MTTGSDAGDAGEADGVDDAVGRLGPERLLAFSDGVVAIALTLLVLPLADLVPDRVEQGQSALPLLTENLTLIGSFLLSFVVIGRFWMVHHQLFDRVRHTTRALVWLNLAWLLTVVVLPFPTEMAGVYRDDPFTLRFYVATLFASSVLLSIMTVVVARAGAAGPGFRHQPTTFVTPALLLVVLATTLVWSRAGYSLLFLLFLGPLVETVLRRRIGRSG